VPYRFQFDRLLREFRVMALQPRELDALCPEPDGSFSATLLLVNGFFESNKWGSNILYRAITSAVEPEM
jgi:hypothetical protein